MELAWAKPGMTGREFVSSLTDSRGWSRSTTLTLLRRLEEKGALRSENVGKVLGYYPLIEREDAAMSETADLIDRVYRGSLSQLVSTFTKRQSLSKEEIDELYAMLRRMEDGHA
ncbi:MAG TPA: BlaI/MecI/CopY family transcriptional regulator [Candidatus Scatomorpha pullicola]|nr:BlaI/MecI/CopY family transcriptional regulator [Candidatus Scatomorpha pullicola]